MHDKINEIGQDEGKCSNGESDSIFIQIQRQVLTVPQNTLWGNYTINILALPNNKFYLLFSRVFILSIILDLKCRVAITRFHSLE